MNKTHFEGNIGTTFLHRRDVRTNMTKILARTGGYWLVSTRLVIVAGCLCCPTMKVLEGPGSMMLLGGSICFKFVLKDQNA